MCFASAGFEIPYRAKDCVEAHHTVFVLNMVFEGKSEVLLSLSY